MKFLNRLIYPALVATVLAVSGFAAAPTAQAAVVYGGVVNLTIPNNGIGLYLNAITGISFSGPGTFPATTGPGSNYDINFFGATTWSAFSPVSSGQAAPTPVPATSKGYVATSTTGSVIALAPGTVIDGSSVYNTGTATTTSLVNITNALFGFRFRNENDVTITTDDTVHYGWARVTLVNGVPGTLRDYGYESTPLTAIAAGAGAVAVVPEAGTLPLVLGAFVALGAGVLVRRRN